LLKGAGGVRSLIQTVLLSAQHVVSLGLLLLLLFFIGAGMGVEMFGTLTCSVSFVTRRYQPCLLMSHVW